MIIGFYRKTAETLVNGQEKFLMEDVAWMLTVFVEVKEFCQGISIIMGFTEALWTLLSSLEASLAILMTLEG